jgi:hypothetical protein
MIQQELSQTLQNLYVHAVSAGTSTVKVEQAVTPKDERLYW